VALNWSLLKRIAFRFFFAYLVLYLFPFPVNAIDAFEDATTGYDSLWARLVQPVGKALFGVDASVLPNGSGDTTFNYVQVFCYLAIAILATLVWSLLDRKREEYARLDAWLRVYVRFGLAAAMIVYGTAKVIPTQFPPPTLNKLNMIFGEQSPMGLLWSFMGASPAYTIFTGFAELTAGLLLTMRRTTLLGALIAAGVMTNVVMLNFCYDVPVKLYSSHLLLMALFLAAPSAKRLIDFFIFNRQTQPVEIPRLLPERWTRLVVPVLRTAVVLLYVGTMLQTTWEYYSGSRYAKPVLYGMWSVEDFSINGQPKAPVLSEAMRWRSVVIDYSSFNVRQMNDTRVRYVAKIDTAKRTIALMRPQPPARTSFTYSQPQRSLIVMQGMLDGKSVRATLKRIDKLDFLLTSRGFHWINEYPMNR